MNPLSDNPLVSIIVRTKDRPKLLMRALQSIAAQTYRPLEVVLVNDGGCDLEIEELKGILGDVSLNYQLLEENRGRSYAGNVGIGHARGEYIGFLDDDDDLYPNHVSILAGHLRRENNPVIYSDSTMAYYEKQEGSEEWVLKKKGVFYSEYFDRDRLVFENYIPLMSLLFKGEVLCKYRFEEDLPAHEDWRLLTLISRDHEFFHITDVTCQYNIYSDSFVSYLETRYNIPHSASLVFERNKKFMDWRAWNNFRRRLERGVPDGIQRTIETMHEALSRMSLDLADANKGSAQEREERKQDIDRLKQDIEEIKQVQNSVLEKMDQSILRRLKRLVTGGVSSLNSEKEKRGGER
jgi:glycosyltransferase involved in cell wall biosynthesis